MGRQFGNYEILRKVASGGMAEIFLAKHRGLGGFERLVCIKRILPHLSEQEDFIKMFQDEARIVANLIHPNIAQIYDIGQLDRMYYIAMEYVRGEDLRRVYNQEVSRGRAMPLEPAAHIVMGAAAGLDFAHRQTSIDGRALGIVHRDVSPQNILVTYDGHVKLIDFGVAKAEGKLNETRSGVLKGKYSYMSPEQASGDPIDGRTDIFALGITLYEVTTGVRLFKRESEIETLHAVIECSVTAPSELIPGYDPELETVVMKALAHDPEERFATAGDMERALERFLVQRGHPTGASSLAAYMQDLFAEKLADELLFGGQPWDESMTPSRDGNATRRLKADVGTTQRSQPSGPTEPEMGEPTDEAAAPEEDTVIEGSNPQSQGSYTPRSAVWGVPDDWATAAESVSKTMTAMAREPEAPRSGSGPRSGPRSVSRPVVISAAPQRKGGRGLLLVAGAILVVSITLAVSLVASSRRRDPGSIPRSGALAVDSEPRGARVVFVGPGAEGLNRSYEGHRTPFTLVEGLPVDHRLTIRFIKDGYEVAEAELPDLQAGVVPEPLFVELQPGAEGAEWGALVVLSTPPGAEVWVDGNKVPGKTPLNDVRVRGGEMHKVEFHLPGYRAHWESIYVEPGSRRFVESRLFPTEPGKGDTAPPVAPDKPPPSVEPSPPTKAPPPAEDEDDETPGESTGGRSYLSISSPLKLKVTIDRRYVGETPLKKLEVDSGLRNVKLTSESEGFTIRRKVRLAPGRTEALEINPRKGNLSVNASPWAWVRLGKTSPAETPVRLVVYEGEYTLFFECPDGKRKKETARVFAGQTASVSVSCRD
jgi:serine/threonine-protein kinase